MPVELRLPTVNPNTNNLRYYQVFSKINNYTGKRLAGYKVVVGTGTGSAFKSASELGIADKQLHLSIGIGEGWSVTAVTSLPNGRILSMTMADGHLLAWSVRRLR